MFEGLIKKTDEQAKRFKSKLGNLQSQEKSTSGGKLHSQKLWKKSFGFFQSHSDKDDKIGLPQIQQGRRSHKLDL